MAKEKQKKIKYSEVVASIVDEKLYFRDAVDWYCLKYLNAKAERTFYITLSIMSFFIVIFLYLTIKSILPLKEKFPVLVRQADSVNYYTTINAIKPDITYNSNKAILRFLLIGYVRNLFDHDYRNGNIEDLNVTLSKVKLYSTDDLYQKYRNDFNQISAEMFNKNVMQTVQLRTFSFIEKKETNWRKKIVNSLFTQIPTEAEITYRLTFNNFTTGEQKITDAKILLSFKYESISYNNIKKEFTKPILVVTDYKIIDGKAKSNVNGIKNETPEQNSEQKENIENNTQSNNIENKVEDKVEDKKVEEKQENKTEPKRKSVVPPVPNLGISFNKKTLDKNNSQNNITMAFNNNGKIK